MKITSENFPIWATIRLEPWKYVGWIPRQPLDYALDELLNHVRTSDHGEIKEQDEYPEGFVCWLKEPTNCTNLAAA